MVEISGDGFSAIHSPFVIRNLSLPYSGVLSY